MGSFFAHLAVAALYFPYKTHLDVFTLLVSAQLADIEYFFKYTPMIVKNGLKIKKLRSIRVGFLHSILGAILFVIPISLLLTYAFKSDLDFSIVLLSAIIGAASHLILDIPAHDGFVLFYPFMMKKDNPLLFRWNFHFINKLYPWKVYEDTQFHYIRHFNYLVVSNAFAIIGLIVFLVFRKA
ncbi:MAG: metal-dependent hydrolase [Nanoarchaeota archaeon]|nr:metal-dependent hydrolase [Nanoarchaeota archaeon]